MRDFARHCWAAAALVATGLAVTPAAANEATPPSELERRLRDVEPWLRGDGSSDLDLAVYVPTSATSSQFTFDGKLRITITDGKLPVHLPLVERWGVRVPAYDLPAGQEGVLTGSRDHLDAMKTAQAHQLPCNWRLLRDTSRTVACEANPVLVLDRLLGRLSKPCPKTDAACRPPEPRTGVQSVAHIRTLFGELLKEAVKKGSIQFVDAKGAGAPIPDIVVLSGPSTDGASFALKPRPFVADVDTSQYMLVVWAPAKKLAEKQAEKQAGMAN